MDLSPFATSCVTMAERLCAEICEHTDYKILCTEGQATVLVEVLAGPQSAGELIGKHGQRAAALRDILGAMGRHDKRVFCRVESLGR